MAHRSATRSTTFPQAATWSTRCPTPGASNRGARRIVARLVTAQLFFTACHYERVQVTGGTKEQRAVARASATATVDEQWRNGFYIITGMQPDLREKVSKAIKAKS